MADGFEYITFRSYTCAVCADGITMVDLAVVNDAGCPEKKGQQIALSVYGDDFHTENCRLSSTQDTLFCGPLPPDLVERYTGFLTDDLRQDRHLRQQFTNCILEGTVDFVFGCGDALFDRCILHSRTDARNMGYAAAPAHSKEQEAGFCFRGCRFTCDEGVAPGSIYLARPWRDYGMCRFEDCSYGSHISPLGFDKWGDTERDKTARFYESPVVPGRVGWVKWL